MHVSKSKKMRHVAVAAPVGVNFLNDTTSTPGLQFSLDFYDQDTSLTKCTTNSIHQ